MVFFATLDAPGAYREGHIQQKNNRLATERQSACSIFVAGNLLHWTHGAKNVPSAWATG